MDWFVISVGALALLTAGVQLGRAIEVGRRHPVNFTPRTTDSPVGLPPNPRKR